MQTRKAPLRPVGPWRDKAASTQLYFIETLCEKGHIKIGVAANVRARMGKMQMDCPYTLRLIKRVENAAHLEAEIHARFDRYRLGGEWFARTDELVEFIGGLEGTQFLETTNLTGDRRSQAMPFHPEDRTVRTTKSRPGVRNRPKVIEGIV